MNRIISLQKPSLQNLSWIAAPFSNQTSGNQGYRNYEGVYIDYQDIHSVITFTLAEKNNTYTTLSVLVKNFNV